MTTQTTETNETTAETTTDNATVELQHQKLTQEQEIQTLRNVHTFLSEYDRVPGALTSQWSQVLDAIALVANSLIAKVTSGDDTPTTTTDDTPTQ